MNENNKTCNSAHAPSEQVSPELNFEPQAGHNERLSLCVTACKRLAMYKEST